MRKIIVLITLVASVFSCTRNIDDLTFTEINPGVQLPIGEFTLSADNLTKLGDSLLVREGDARVIEFYYETELLQALLGDRFTIGDQTFSDQIPFNSFVFVAGATNEVKLSASNAFTISNSDLPAEVPSMKKIIFKGGFINVNQSKDFDHRVETTITIPTLTKGGVPFSATLINSDAQNEPLLGYELDLTGASGLSTNTIEYEISTIVKNTGVSTTGTISFTFQLAAMKFSYLEGDFNTYQFDPIEGDFVLGLPEIDIPENIGFTNPQVGLLINNSAGMEIGLDIVELSVTQFNGNKILVIGSFDDTPTLISAANLPGEIATSEFSISNGNTDNLTALFSAVPQSAFFKGTSTVNPSGVPVNGNFVTDSSELVVNAELVLPLEGYANNYAIVDTLRNVNLQIGDNGIVSLGGVNLRLQVENGFPFDIGLQMYFLDSMNQNAVIDSLFATQEEQKLFFSANVDDTGLAISPSNTTTDITIGNELYEKIKFAKNIKLAIYLLTSGADAQPQRSVRISANDYITVGMGISANAIIDLNKAKSN